MRALFSLVSLLVVLAIVGLIAKHQMAASGLQKAGAASAASQPAQIEKQVQDDVNRLMQGRASDLEQQQAEPKP